MKRVMMWLGGIVLACVVVFVGLMLVLPLVLDPNDYKGKITDIVYDKSGYRLEIPGDIKLQITPGLDVLFTLGQIRVQSGPDFPDTPLLSSEEARVELSLMPLLREKRLAIQGLSLHGVYCNLMRNKAGKENWKNSAGAATSSGDGAQVNTDSASQAPTAEKDKKGPSLELGALDVSRITVRFEDQQAGKRFELKDFSVQTNHVQDGKPFHLQSKFSLISSGKDNSALSAVNTLESDVTLALAANTVQLDKLQLVSQISGFGVQETEVQLGLDAFLDLAEKNAKIKTLSLRSGKMVIQAMAEVTDFSNPIFHGSLQISDFSLREFLEQNKISQPDWKEDSALRQIGFSCTFEGDKKRIAVSDMEALFDGAHAKGSFILLDPAHPAYDFQMHVDRLDLDRYKSRSRKSEVPVAQNKAKAVQAAGSGNTQQTSLQPLFPVETLKGLQFQLSLDADSMKVSGAELSKVALQAQGKNGLLELKPFRAELYKGSIAVEATLDVRGDLPQLQIKKDLKGVQAGPLLKDMTGKEELSGTAVLSLQLTTKGNTREQLTRNANGKMNFTFADGVIKKLHLLQVVRQAKAIYEGGRVVESAAEEPTGFANISGSGVIRNGVLNNNDLRAESDLMKVTGSGKVDFGDEYVDYLLNITLLRGLDRNEKTGRTDYSKFVIPYRIQGKFSNLKEEADVTGLLKSAAQGLLMDELQKQLNKEGGGTKSGEKKNSTQELLEQGLKGLFGN
ncbi:MAG: AsmA family protein [Desulfocapsa sp.]|nr:AsmA family protein [Desulfocapsa sp.]